MAAYEQDWLLRQINHFALALAEQLSGRVVHEDEEEQEVENLLGTPIHTFVAMADRSLVNMFRGPEGFEGKRALAVVVGFSHKALELDAESPDEAARLRSRAWRLLRTALDERPELLTEEVAALRQALAHDRPH